MLPASSLTGSVGDPELVNFPHYLRNSFSLFLECRVVRIGPGLCSIGGQETQEIGGSDPSDVSGKFSSECLHI